jgi:hypothetical protein
MMALRKVNYHFTTVVWAIGLAVIVMAAVSLMHSPKAHAQAGTDKECRATIVLDRSGSVGAQNMNTLHRQVERLFQVGGLYDDRIKLAFWSFGDDFVWPWATNYNAPSYGFVSSRGSNTGFNNELAQVRSYSLSGTNYEHALGYHRGGQNSFIADTANNSDLIVFLTDGEPNPVGSREASRAAALGYYAKGTDIIGGLIGTTKKHMNYVLNGSESNDANTFTISTNYNDLSDKLNSQIRNKCFPPAPPCEFNPSIPETSPDCKPPVPLPYSLVPTVNATSTVISGTDSAGFEYKVENNSSETASASTSWSVKRLVVERGQSVDPLQFGGAAYRDSYSCPQLVSLVGGKATCTDSGAAGSKVFPRGTTTMSAAELGTVSTTAVDDAWQVGTKLCFVFTIDKPTENPNPTNRYSKAACVIVGKRPTFQVHGGDVSVGRYFEGDEQNTTLHSVRGSVTAKLGSINKTFGSWVEYGIQAPGIVSGVASASGLEGGYDGSVVSNQDLWSKLTFANNSSEYGKFTGENGMGKVSNMAEYFIKGRAPVRDLSASPSIAFNGGGVVNGLYEKATGNLTLDASTLEKGKFVIVHVPNGTVTINGDLKYNQGPFSSVGEIPQLIVIAKNISINGSVTTVDSWLIAQDGEKRGGTVTTCDQAPPLTSESCNRPLKVNGPVVAKDLLLRRTGGAGAGQASGEAAETFNLRADAYLWGYNEGKSSLRAETTYTKELPPQF